MTQKGIWVSSSTLQFWSHIEKIWSIIKVCWIHSWEVKGLNNIKGKGPSWSMGVRCWRFPMESIVKFTNMENLSTPTGIRYKVIVLRRNYPALYRKEFTCRKGQKSIGITFNLEVYSEISIKRQINVFFYIKRNGYDINITKKFIWEFSKMIRS